MRTRLRTPTTQPTVDALQVCGLHALHPYNQAAADAHAAACAAACLWRDKHESDRLLECAICLER